MYLNVIDSKKDTKQSLLQLLGISTCNTSVATQKEEKKIEVKHKPEKKRKVKKDTKTETKEEVDIDALLDKAVAENRKCHLATCSTQIMSFQYCLCRKCNKAFCSSHALPRSHDCTNGNTSSKPVERSDYHAEASQQTKAKARQALAEMQAKRMAKPTKAEMSKLGQQKK